MKKLIVIGLLFLTYKGFSQVTKTDFTFMFNSFKFENMTAIYVKNSRTYYMNGTNSLEQTEYKAGYFTIELKENAIYLVSYEDNTKAKISGYNIIPYTSMLRISAGSKAFTIELKA